MKFLLTARRRNPYEPGTNQNEQRKAQKRRVANSRWAADDEELRYALESQSVHEEEGAASFCNMGRRRSHVEDLTIHQCVQRVRAQLYLPVPRRGKH